MAQRNVFLFVDDVDQHRVPLVEGSATAVLPAQANWSALQRERSKGQRLSHAVVQGALTVAHFAALFEQLLHLGMDVEILGVFRQTVGDALQLRRWKSRIN